MIVLNLRLFPAKSLKLNHDILRYLKTYRVGAYNKLLAPITLGPKISLKIDLFYDLFYQVSTHFHLYLNRF